ncbi:hypothetical protein KCP69_17900 [Salmonella enterica subsp. enterica]|nr:hypothetical protein KCP69_17900 [Salmonella enterica subsp. enterica]
MATAPDPLVAGDLIKKNPDVLTARTLKCRVWTAQIFWKTEMRAATDAVVV